ncbi:sre-21, partial [Pristionchus pacificus]|uniref:Sre-21 n=1 Tax=Pristionchus pacificus TaxID=54126 RepID=A0A2A6C7B8_PRIPA
TKSRQNFHIRLSSSRSKNIGLEVTANLGDSRQPEQVHIFNRYWRWKGGIVVFVMPQWALPQGTWTIITILTIFEIIFMLIFAFILSISVPVISKHSSMFHPNMMRMSTFLLCDFYFYVTSRIVLIFYQFDLLNFSEFISVIGIIIISSSMLRVYTAFSILIERFFASIFVRDYETNHRAWIVFVELIIVIMLSIIGSCDITFALFNFAGVTAPILLFVTTLSAGLMAIILFFYNKRRLETLIKRSEKYTFTERYQLDENIRAFKFLLLIAGAATPCGCTCFLIMILRTLNFKTINSSLTSTSHLLSISNARYFQDRNFAAISGAAFDTCLAITVRKKFSACNAWLSVILYKQPVWREEFIAVVFAILKLDRTKAPRRSKIAASKVLGMEGDIYFRDLSGSWDSHGLAIFTASSSNEKLSTLLSASLVALTIVDFIFEIILLTVLFMITGIVAKSSVFHPNMIRIALFFIFHLYLHVISRLLLYLNQLKILNLSENGFDVSTIIVLVISVVRIHTAFAINATLLALVIERLFVTYLSRSYESTDRKCISYCILTLAFCFGAFFGVESIIFAIRGATIFSYVGGICAVSGILGIVLYLYNVRKLKQIVVGSCPYLFQGRYQLDENIRAFKKSYKISFSCSKSSLAAFMSVNIVLMIVRHLNRTNQVAYVLCGAMFDAATAIAFFLWGSIVFSQQPVWREEFLDKLFKLINKKRYLTIFADYNKFDTSEWIIAIIHCLAFVEFVLITVLILGLFAATSTVRKTTVFHPNLMRIFYFFVVHIYIFRFTRIVIYLYQVRAIDISQDVDFCTVFIIGTSIVRLYICFAVVFILVAVVAERGFATLLIRDYEKKDRYWIAIFELSCVFSISLALGLNFETMLLNFLPWQIGYVFIFSFAICAGLMAVFLDCYNKRRLRKITSTSNCKYSLAVRYQLEENVRAFKVHYITHIWKLEFKSHALFVQWLRTISITGAALICIDFALYLTRLLNFNKLRIRLIGGAVFDLLIVISFLVWGVVAISSEPTWKEQFLIKFGFSRRNEKISYTMSDKLPSDDGDVYFKGLTAVWDAHAISVFADYVKYESVIPSWTKLFVQILALIEFMFIVVLGVSLLLVALVVRGCSAFHPNMMRIIAHFQVHVYVYIFTRIFNYLYQIRVIDFSDTLDAIGIFIIVSSAIRLYSAFTVVFLLVALVIERLFATILVPDYEKSDRYWIAVAELSIVFVLALVFGFGSTSDKINYKCHVPNTFIPGVYTFAIILALASSAGVLAFLLYFWNTRLLRNLVGVRSRYTLSERYQLQENIRAFRFLLIVGLAGSLVMCIDFSLMVFRLLNRSDKLLRVLCGACFDLMVALSFNVLGVVSILNQPTWWELILEKIATFRGKMRKTNSILPQATSDEGDVYFRSLGASALAVFADYMRYSSEIPEWSITLIQVFSICEFIFITVLIILLILTAGTIRGSSVFHPNMMRIIAYFLVHVYVYIITRVVNYLYQTRIIDFDGIFRMSGMCTFGIILALASSAGIMAIILYYHNTKILRKIIGIHSHYTLSERYQLKENIRAFKFLLIVGSSGSLVICLDFTLMVFRLLYRADVFVKIVCGASFDLVVSISFNALGVLSVLSEPTWKELILDKIASIFGKKSALAVFSHFKDEPLSFGEDLAICAMIIVEFMFMTFFAVFLMVVAIIVGKVIVLPVNELGLIGTIIVAMSIIRCYVAYAVAFVLLAFVIERLFATILLRDYERKKRSWIASMEIVVVSTSGMLLSLDTTFKAYLPPGANLVLVVLISLIAGVLAIYLYYHNRKCREAMINHQMHYTLPERYQLDENIKAFKFLLTIAVPGAFLIGGLFMLLIARLLLRFNRPVYFISGAAYDTGVAVSLSIWGLIVFFLQPTWREMFLHEAFRLVNRKRDRAPKVSQRSSTIDSDIYFESLRNAWDSPIPK